MEILPAILTKDKTDFDQKLQIVESFATSVHIDVADGIFVPTMTIDAEDVMDVETDIPLWLHLMVNKPEHHVVSWLQTPISSISFHIEATDKALEIIQKVRDAEKHIGIALNPSTSISRIESLVDMVDFIQFMTVKPGAYGSPFLPEVLETIKDFHYFYPDKNILADGGINPENLLLLKEVGVTDFAVGSYLFEHADVKIRYNELQKLL